MNRRSEFFILLFVDTIAVGLASVVYYLSRFEWLWFDTPAIYPEISLVVLFMVSYWVAVFFFFGMYRERYASSRFDELLLLLKTTAVGILVLVFAIFIDILQPGSTRALIFFYGFVVFGSVATGRMLVRTVQKMLILRGYGTHKAIIVGWSDRVEKLHEDVGRYPAAGLNVVGALRIQAAQKVMHPVAVHDGNEMFENEKDVYTYEMQPEGEQALSELPEIIDRLGVQDVLIALGPNEHNALMEVLRLCDGKNVSLKLVPDFYTVIGGMARTEHLYGLPLIEVLPEPMPVWEQSTKRLIDIIASLIILVLGAPMWLLLMLAVRMTSTGPAIYKQKRVGHEGQVFTMYKFRTMHSNAEAKTGPVWATEDDPRYTPLGRWLRKTRLDEVPQFVNVLKGDMSLVGPRPERPYFVEILSREIPLYSRRYRVKPGITGWAQVMWGYDTCLDDVRQKVKYDLFYLANMSLGMDFKILFMTLRTTFTGKGQ